MASGSSDRFINEFATTHTPENVVAAATHFQGCRDEGADLGRPQMRSEDDEDRLSWQMFSDAQGSVEFKPGKAAQTSGSLCENRDFSEASCLDAAACGTNAQGVFNTDVKMQINCLENQFKNGIYELSNRNREKFDLIFAILAELQTAQKQMEETVGFMQPQQQHRGNNHFPAGIQRGGRQNNSSGTDTRPRLHNHDQHGSGRQNNGGQYSRSTRDGYTNYGSSQHPQHRGGPQQQNERTIGMRGNYKHAQGPDIRRQYANSNGRMVQHAQSYSQ